MNDHIADILADTREYIEKNGWWRGGLVGPNGRQVCLVGGVLKSQHWHGETLTTRGSVGRQVGEAIFRVLRTEVGFDVLQVEYWNDHVAKDKQHVLDVLAKAEKLERAGFDPDV